MRGPSAAGNGDGLIPLSVREIFSVIRADTERNYKVSVSYLEVSLTVSQSNSYFSTQLYNECINDLLDTSNKNLEVRESITKGLYVNKLSENSVEDLD